MINETNSYRPLYCSVERCGVPIWSMFVLNPISSLVVTKKYLNLLVSEFS